MKKNHKITRRKINDMQQDISVGNTGKIITATVIATQKKLMELEDIKIQNTKKKSTYICTKKNQEQKKITANIYQNEYYNSNKHKKKEVQMYVSRCLFKGNDTSC